jgi:A/G-specific adenine glycosylase
MLPPFAERLLQWYELHGRHDLPWQLARTPYRVWVSEVMLQQTQVTTVIPFFERFMARFPDVAALATAPIDEVLHHWTGLGYYARARNLHKAAGVLVHEHEGEFPLTVDAVATLPGIGRSTAGAILALSRNVHAPILDGNVKRVLTRHRAIAGWPDAPATQRALWPLAEALTPQERVADYTQAIMDLGATLCVRRQPACGECPVAADCVAYARGEQHAFPTRKPRKALPVRHTTMLVLTRATDGALLLARRPASGIWGGLWSFPEVADAAGIAAVCANFDLDPAGSPLPLPAVSHTFTHFQLEITPMALQVRERGTRCMDCADLLWYNSAAPAAVGLPRPVQDLIHALSPPSEGHS